MNYKTRRRVYRGTCEYYRVPPVTFVLLYGTFTRINFIDAAKVQVILSFIDNLKHNLPTVKLYTSVIGATRLKKDRGNVKNISIGTATSWGTGGGKSSVLIAKAIE